MKKLNMSLFSLVLLLVSTQFANAETPQIPKDLDTVVNNALKEFNTPGMSVGVVYKNDVLLSKGYGLANIDQNTPVNEDTLFRLASTSKAFTAAALAILVDEGKLTWDSRVIDYLPQFKLHDPYATREFTVVDLLSHRSGLVSGAGDSMIWPEPSGFSRQEVIENLEYLQPEYSFRSQYAYSNVLYITAGEIVSAVSNMSFDNFVEENIFKPLDMDCFVGDIPNTKLQNAAMSYGYNDDKGIYPIPRNSITDKGLMSAAAGGMVCSVDDMLKWVKALLQGDELPFSEQQLARMWRGDTLLRPSRLERDWDNTTFKSYGLGWRLSNIGRFKAVSHTGTLSGYQAYVMLIPELELGIAILNNGSNSAARGSVMQTILKSFLSEYDYKPTELESNDWIASYIDYWDEREQAYLSRFEEPIASAPMSLSDDDIVGVYTDKWFGDLVISKQSKNDNQSVLRIHSSRMSTLKGTIRPFQATTFKIEWDNKNAQGDAFMHFNTNVKREVTDATLHPFHVEQFTNHEYRDMHFFKAETTPPD